MSLPAEQHAMIPKGQMVQESYASPQMMAGGHPSVQPPPGLPAQIQVPRPGGMPGVPPGLEYLAQIDQLLIQQQVEIAEALTGFETKNKYVIKNIIGQQVYFAAEESDCCGRFFCGPRRGFVIHIIDNFAQEVIRVTREFKCCAGHSWCACCLCCAMEIRIEAPVGQVCGFARQLQSCIKPCYSIMDADQKEVLYVEGPLCRCQTICCSDDLDFKVYTADRSQKIGKLSKQWSGVLKEALTDADNFRAAFPMDLDVRIKAVLVGTVFLMDFMYFEQNEKKKTNIQI